MYTQGDPRSSLSSASAAPSDPRLSGFAGTEYLHWNKTPPDSIEDGVRTWWARGQTFIICYSVADAGGLLSRDQQPDEYVALFPDDVTAAELVGDGHGQRNCTGACLAVLPPGRTQIRLPQGGRVVRLFTSRSTDLIERCSNVDSYRTPHPDVRPFESWPEPNDGLGIRVYSFDVPPEPGRFGRIWRCSTFMVNVLDPVDGRRDPTKMSPHHHDDFEQCSLAVAGAFRHHVRWPWIPDMTKWRPDEHELCESPSAAIIPPPSIHTSEAWSLGRNFLIDIFCPPRVDFSERPGWVLNASEYPMRSKE